MRPVAIFGLRWLPRIFLAVTVAGLLYVWIGFAQPLAPVPRPAAAQPLNDLAARTDALESDMAKIEDEQNTLEKRVATLQTQLGWMLAAAGLFTLIQGLFAFFGSQNFIQQADRIIGDLEKRQKAAVEQLEKVDQDVKSRYPIFHRAEQKRIEAFEILRPLAENSDWRDKFYEQLTVKDRQRLLSLESFVGLEFLEEGQGMAGNLRLMGNFYASKYVSEGRRNPADLDRAQYYLELALEDTKRAFHHLNDYGLLHLQIMEPPRPHDAERYFTESRSKRKDHQRAPYNLASILHDRGLAATPVDVKVAHFLEAHSLLTEALTYKDWELTPSDDRKGNIHYNLACCLTRLSECDASVKPEDRLRSALASLREAALIGRTKPETLYGDLDGKEGDLMLLSRCGTQDIQDEVERVVSLFYQVWATKGITFKVRGSSP